MAKHETVVGVMDYLNNFSPLDCVYVKDKDGNLLSVVGFDRADDDEPVIEIAESTRSTDDDET